MGGVTGRGQSAGQGGLGSMGKSQVSQELLRKTKIYMYFMLVKNVLIAIIHVLLVLCLDLYLNYMLMQPFTIYAHTLMVNYPNLGLLVQLTSFIMIRNEILFQNTTLLFQKLDTNSIYYTFNPFLCGSVTLSVSLSCYLYDIYFQ